MIALWFWLVAAQASEPWSVRALNQAAAISAGTTVEGFVIFASDCPPCPPKVLCEPCVRKHVILSDRARAASPGRSLLRPDEAVILLPSHGGGPTLSPPGKVRITLAESVGASPQARENVAASMLRERRAVKWEINGRGP